MRKVDRPAKPPAVFQDAALKKIKKDTDAFYKDFNKPGFGQRRPPSASLPAGVARLLKIELDKVFCGRCAYCESPVDISSTKHGYDHFRPRGGARGLKNEFSRLHYWCLTLEWQNLYLCCSDCNKHKGSWFPVKGKRSNSNKYETIMKEEKPLLLDPCDPSFNGFYFSYIENGELSTGSDSERSRRTIDILGLNRRQLVEDRKKALAPFTALRKEFEKAWLSPSPDKQEVERLVKTLLDYITTLFDPETRVAYPTIQRVVVQNWINPAFSKGEIYRYFIENVRPRNISKILLAALESADGVALKKLIRENIISEARREWNKEIEVIRKYDPTDTGSIFLDKIVVRNFRGIKELELDFPVSPDDQASWLMLLGENSVGKSSFLQAVALALAGNAYIKKLDPHASIRPKHLLRHGSDQGSVEIYATSAVDIKSKRKSPAYSSLGDPVTLDLTRKAVHIVSNLKKPGTFVFGYGSTRLFPTKKLKPEFGIGRIRIQNLFDPGTSLIDAKKWMLGITKTADFDRVALTLKDLLLLKDNDLIKKEKGNIYIYFAALDHPEEHINRIALEELSDGYKSIIAVAADMMQTLMRSKVPIESAEGIVLLDEIGTHLHPRWRMEVVRRFRKAFPRLQFLVTTHDPLCLRGLKRGEIVVLKKDAHNKPYAVKDLPDPSEFRADQLLSSEFFGLSSTIDPELEKDFNEYYDLLRKENRLTKKQTQRLEELKKLLTGRRHLGNSLREELAFEAVDKLLATEKSTEANQQRAVLKDSTIKMVQGMWSEILNKQKS
jgi:uncharacterized protein (TIGR02646 family)